ncbi:MAG: flagellar basal body-associated FliL family protein [Pseudomonadales bacterium]|nr:flagellar basal body-associated FliL family protein [Pseudomonadales bacterium]
MTMVDVRSLNLLLLCVAGLAGYVSAAEGDEESGAGAAHRDVRYVDLQPAFITNVGVSDNGSLMYVKTDISVRVSSQQAEMATRYHLPALRNALVLLLSRQDEATVSTGRGREMIRAEALSELRTILENEEGAPYLDDLMFTNFIVQR